jgi:membrane fusion protein (multidrug efflux system)
MYVYYYKFCAWKRYSRSTCRPALLRRLSLFDQGPSLMISSLHHWRASPRKAIRVLALAGVVMAMAACHKSAPDAGKGPPGGGAMPVSVVQVHTERVPALIEAVGQTEGSREVEIRARVSGILQKRLYQEGDAVPAGAVLFRIEREPYEIALDQAKAALGQEQARRTQAEREALRMKELAAEKAVSQKEYDDAASAFQQTRASELAAQAKVREAELNLSYVTVIAPIKGITGRAQRSEGTLVTAGTDSALLTTVVQTDPIWVRFSFSESEYMQLRSAGRKADVKLTLPDGGVFNAGGHINFTASTVDSKLGTVQLRAEFANPRLTLLPGQFVHVQVLTGEQDAFLVPQPAVLQNEQGRFVWVAGADGKATMRPVEASAWSGGNWVVRKGLADGDQVIVDNILKLRPGAAVQTHAAGNASQPAATTPAKGTAQPSSK